jgi:MFS family permease
VLAHVPTRLAMAVSGGRPAGPRLARMFLGWVFVRAILHNGWWLLASLYMVVDAGLSPAELLVIAAAPAQGAPAVVFELPAGVLADALSRKWAIVVAHALMAAAMIATALFPSFVPLLASQMLWGIAWTFSSGADVAWITDELNEPERMHHVLSRQARWQLAGAGVGMVALGALGTLIGRPVVIVGAGVAMLALGGFVAARFPERNFVPIRTHRWRGAIRILRRGRRWRCGTGRSSSSWWSPFSSTGRATPSVASIPSGSWRSGCRWGTTAPCGSPR